MSRVLDVFPLGYGADVLLIRLRTLADVVDEHVIVDEERGRAAAGGDRT